jgi:menaquinone-dependent protoporphyrinogen oxidase
MCVVRVLVAYGSKRGGTEGLAQMVASYLRQAGFAVDVLPARGVKDLGAYDTVLVGGALYSARWHRDARRFVKRQTAQLRRRPTYFFSSGPLDHSADQGEIPPVKGVAGLMQRVGAREHTTFGGRLAPDAKGFPAATMARKNLGDWRSADQVRSWTHHLASELRGEVEEPGLMPLGRLPGSRRL